MHEQDNRQAVLDYYSRSEDKGYWGYLKGVCHYGYTDEKSVRPFDMACAQTEMENILGETLALPAGSKVLDAGCGYGPVARTLASEFGYQVTGIDLIQPRLYKAKELNQEDEVSTVDLINADYHMLPFADGSFDGIYTMETLVHANDYEKVLREFRRVLKPNGKVVLFEYSIPELDSVPLLVRKLANRVITNTGMTSLPAFTHGAFPSLLEDAGFENPKSDEVSNHVYSSWFYLWKFAIMFTLDEIRHGRVGLDNIPGSMWIWPARHWLGYNISSATKPKQETRLN